jgi:hypothetical protein
MTSLQDIYREATSRFLQSVIVVDDRAALVPEEGDLPPEHAEVINPSVRAEQVPAEEPPSGDIIAEEMLAEAEAAHEGDALVNALDARALIDRFAELGIVCAALRPDPTDMDVESRVLRAGQRADIVTLDWHLGHGESGARARNLLDLLTQPAGKRLRLVAVYTGDADEVLLRSEITGLDGVQAVDDYRFERGSARIVLLFKDGTEENGAPPGQVTPVGDLPDRLIAEFAEMTAGLVPAAAMSSLGAIREATPEIVGVLSSALDPGYVGHRLAQVIPDDAGDHLTDLVVSEIRSVLELDSQPIPAANTDAVQLWLDDLLDPEVTIERDALAEVNIRGVGDPLTLDALRAKYPLLQAKGKKTYPTRYFVADPDAADRHDALLAERMATRYTYKNARPERLELGIVVKCLADDSYWVCVQPVCDSVRLTSDTSILLLPLVGVAAKEKWDLTVILDGAPAHFEAIVKPQMLRGVTFSPDPSSRSILAAPVEGEPSVFTDTKGTKWALVRRLKTAHGQRLAHRLGVAFSRVGLNESEWQSRQTPR